ncbi:3-oxo-tetronate kinase [Streptomyces sp. NPDC058374]|uniref:3-oxo-tetronate kinase n=1 Tax=Streptomyces sp. NPDC058374 TaxID=3346466 RepID=UPI00364C5CF8
MPTLGAIADDFTGATDLATMLVSRGFRTLVAIGADAVDPAAAADADAVVVALKSRTAPVDEAVADSLAALRALRAAGCRRYYFKYCSTFDSTPRGNIGPVADALLDAVHADRTVVVPAFPATGRTVRDGLLYVHGEPLDRSPMRHHPLTPMTDASLERLLRPQTRRPVRRIPLDTVRAGTEPLRAAVDAPGAAGALLVVDAVTDDDLRTVSAATGHLGLVTGAAGLALGLTGPHPGAARATPASGPGAPAAVLSGSASSTTRAQVAHGRARLPHRKLDIAALRRDLHGTVADLAAFAREQWRLDPARPPLFHSVDDLDDLERTAPPGETPAPALVEEALAALAVTLVDDGARRLLVAGGETSGAVVTALAVRRLAIGAPLAPGVTWARAETGTGSHRRSIDLALKSGNFGDTDIFTEAWSALV